MIRLYRLLLGLYPRWFRERYQQDLVDAFAADRCAPRHTGVLGGARFWLSILVDLVASAARVRRSARSVAASPTVRRNLMDVVAQDLRHAARQLIRRPGFTAVAVLSLALGIGGNAVIMAFFDGFVFHPFAYPEPDRVVTIGSTLPQLSTEEAFVEAISAPEFVDIRSARSIATIAALDLANRNISGGDRPERVFTALTFNDLFAPFGLPPALGRGFTADELVPFGPSVAIISHRLWQGRFGGDQAIVGKTVRVNGVSTTVVGVMPPELLVLGTDLWLPAGLEPEKAMPRNARLLTLIGRLAPGATLEEANAELATIARQTTAQHGARFPEYAQWRLSAMPWTHALMRDIRPAAWLLLGAVALVLLIVCANLSNLLLARSASRRREMAVRHALGAGQARIAAHLLAEVALLAIAGAIAGLLLAHAALPLLINFVPPQLNTLGVTASINGRVVAWSALLTVGSAVLVTLLPLFQSMRAHPQEALQRDGRGATAAPLSLGLRSALIVGEIALSVILLMGAGLMVRSLGNLQAVEPGFDPRNVLTMRITLPREKYRDAAVHDFFQTLVETLQGTAGVKAAAVASQLPPQGPFSTPFRIVGAEPTTGISAALRTTVSESYFGTLGVQLLAGRVFDNGDRASTPPVVVINEAFASRFLRGVVAVGQRVSIGSAERHSPSMEIVGVVSNTQNRGASEPASPEIFVALHQQLLDNQLLLFVRSEGEAAAMLPTVRQQLARLDPEQPIYAVRTLEAAFAADAFGVRFPMTLLAIFATVALTVAALGIYGVMSYAVSARTQEIGVRLAVGADRRHVIWMVLRQVMRLTLIGLAIGVAGALALSGTLRRALFEVQPADPLTLATVVLLLGSVAVMAGWLPAWRASRVDPIHALRDQ